MDAPIQAQPPEATSRILRVRTEDLPIVWFPVASLLSPLLQRLKTHDTEDVRRMIMGSQAHLWVQWSGNLDCAVVTEFITYPKGVWLRIWLTVARQGALVDWPAFAPIMSDWALRHGCQDEIEMQGRPGWKRRYPGLKEVRVTMRLPIGKRDEPV